MARGRNGTTTVNWWARDARNVGHHRHRSGQLDQEKEEKPEVNILLEGLQLLKMKYLKNWHIRACSVQPAYRACRDSVENTLHHGAPQGRESNPSVLRQFLWERLGLYLEESGEQYGKYRVPSESNQSAGWQDQFLDQEPIVQMSLCLVLHSAGLAEVSEEFGQAATLN